LPGDLQLVCSRDAIDYSLDELRSRIESSGVADALAKAWQVNDVEGFLGHFVANSRWADAIYSRPDVPQNTDDRTLLEYRFAKTVGRSTPFAIEEVRDFLRAAGFHQPALGGGAADWNRIELRRQEFNLIFAGQLSIGLLPDPADRAVVEAFDFYRLNRFAEALAIWPPERLPPATDIQRLVYARCQAELARPESLDLIAAMAERFPTEAAALRATYQWRAGNTALAAQALEEFYTRLAKSPWLILTIADSALSRTIDVARADREAARRLYTLLSRPFASHRLEDIRLAARSMVAIELGPKDVAAAMEEMEPNVIWSKEVLEARAEAYADLNHPLAAQAARDWQWFQEHQTHE
jgi:hypothetical protein